MAMSKQTRHGNEREKKMKPNDTNNNDCSHVRMKLQNNRRENRISTRMVMYTFDKNVQNYDLRLKVILLNGIAFMALIR